MTSGSVISSSPAFHIARRAVVGGALVLGAFAASASDFFQPLSASSSDLSSRPYYNVQSSARHSAYSMDSSAALRVGSIFWSRQGHDISWELSAAPFTLLSAAATPTLMGEDENRLTDAERADLYTIRTRLFAGNGTPCTVKLARGKYADKAWSDLQDALWSEGRKPIVETLPQAIELVVDLHGEPTIRSKAKYAARQLLDCDKKSKKLAELQVLAMALSSPEQVSYLSEHHPHLQPPRSTPAATSERALYPINKGRGKGATLSPPRLCLAMSGGGVRSAAFQIGVLQGLQETGLLSRVDVMSSVSGGGYAMSWYVAARIKEAGGSLQPPLQVYYQSLAKVLNSIFERELHTGKLHTENQTLVEFESGGGSNEQSRLQGGSYKFLQEPELAKDDSKRAKLVTRLEAAFLAVTGAPATLLEVPYDALESSLPSVALLEHRDYRALLREAYDVPTLTLHDLGRQIELIDDLAFPVYTAAVRPADCASKGPLGLAQDIDSVLFEFTPLHAGTRNPGFSTRAANYYSVDEASAISGAALDFPHGYKCKAVNTAKVRLGTKACDNSGSCRFITDGGYVDNLGIASLTRRECGSIIVVDAEYDPGLIFESYQRISAALQETKEISFFSPAIDDIAQKTSKRCTAEDRPHCFITAVRPSTTTPVRSRSEPRPWYSATFRGSRTSQSIPVLYLKLAVAEGEERSYDAAVSTAISLPCRGKNCAFPHIPTSNQSLDARHFLGLRRLGRQMVQEAMNDKSCASCVAIRNNSFEKLDPPE